MLAVVVCASAGPASRMIQTIKAGNRVSNDTGTPQTA